MWFFLFWDCGVLWEAVDSYGCSPENKWYNTFHLWFQRFLYLVKILFLNLRWGQEGRNIQSYLTLSMSCQTYRVGLYIMEGVTAYWLLWHWDISVWAKAILILEIVLFSDYLHKPMTHLHFYLFSCLTQLFIIYSSIFLELSKYSRHTVKVDLDDPSV